MAYKSTHKGSQIDTAVSTALYNKGKGSASEPVRLDQYGRALPVTIDTTVTANSANLVTSDAVFDGLAAVVDNSEIQTSTSLGTSGMPPSQNAVKQYVDNSLPAKQDTLYGGYGIDVDGATVSVGDDVFREDEEARLHADLKVDHFGDMSIGNDSEVLELMDQAKHSSFDKSKFTVVGSPIVTTEGIASGFSSSNYIDTGLSVLDFINKSWAVEVPMVYLGNAMGISRPLICWGTTWSENGSICYITNDKRFVFRAKTGDNTESSDGSTRIQQPVQSSIPNKSICRIEFNINTGTYTMYVDGILSGNWTPTTTNKQLYLINTGSSSTKLWIAHSQQGDVYNNAIDLKYFKVEIDGVEVFSGNKTGIDTIKPDDYTVVGSNVIVSPSGIASGFDSTSYLLSNTFSIKGTDTLRYEIKVLLPSSVSGTMDILEAKTTDNLMFTRLFIQADNTLTLYAYDGTTNGSVDAGASYSGKEVYIRCTVSNVLRKIEVSLDGENWTSYQSTTVMAWSGTENDYQFNIGWYGSDNYFINPIDLNTFKVYINDSLVAQPLLKVPYTQTKDGKKIVDSVYRSRVEDEYTQAGFTPYYTLSDTDYTMATVEEDDIISSYIDGANAYTQKANQELEIQGACTAETAVTFPNSKAFMDTNYALSIPYVSGTKTKTGFTPAIDGDYIAEGFTSI